jgi:hypothetical protein
VAAERGFVARQSRGRSEEVEISRRPRRPALRQFRAENERESNHRRCGGPIERAPSKPNRHQSRDDLRHEHPAENAGEHKANCRALVAFRREKRRERSHELRRNSKKPDRKGPQKRDGRVWRGGGKRKRGCAQRQHRHDQPTPFEHVGEGEKGDNPGRETDLRDRREEADAVDGHHDARGDDRQQGLGIVDVRCAKAAGYCEQPDYVRQAWC